tara:strand:- start:513 stop:713 length:201 start_codon:yes stop_codon:yes gene_type:complete
MSWKSDKVIPIYKNGHGIYELIKELQKGARELEKQEKEKLRSGETGKRDLLLAENLVVRLHPPQPS